MTGHSDNKWISVTKWAPIVGIWNFAEANSTYVGNASIGAGNGSELFAIAVCDERFRDGSIRTNVRFDGPDGELTYPEGHGPVAGIILGYHSEKSYLVAGLGAYDFAYSIFEPWEMVKIHCFAGSRQNLRFNQTYELLAKQTGQRITFVIDGVPVLEHVLPTPPPGNQLGLFARARLPVHFEDFKVQRKDPTAFIAMQFGGPYDNVYRSVIRPVAAKLGFEVVRIDEVNRPGIIFQDIQRRIEDAKVVIAEITAPNQNVFYEVGYAHALNKPTILLAQRDRELPFDIRSYRVIFYDDSISGKQTVERTLRQHLQSVLQEI